MNNGRVGVAKIQSVSFHEAFSRSIVGLRILCQHSFKHNWHLYKPQHDASITHGISVFPKKGVVAYHASATSHLVRT